MRAVSWRLLPLLMLAYLVAYLDRVNLGFAALTMNEELKFSSLVFSWGAGIFFIGYFLFEVPSNVILHKVGASRWIARIMVSWGVVSVLMALVSGPVSFYVLRFLLGVAEAGFFPGIILYLTYWYPAKYRARILAGFAVAVPVSTVIGAPISGYLLGLDGIGGLRGWQWLFILEGLPAVLLGIVTWFCLTDRPAAAAWLDAAQKQWLADRLGREETARRAAHRLSPEQALASPVRIPVDGATGTINRNTQDIRHLQNVPARPLWGPRRDIPLRVLVLSLVYFGFVGALYGMQFWLPQIVKAFGLSNVQTGFVTAIPYLFGSIAMVLWARHSDRSRERVWHVVLPLLLIAFALAAASALADPVLTMVALTVAAIGVFCTFSLFWTLPTAFLSGASAAAGIALINSIGNLAGFGGPYLIGWFKEQTGGTAMGLLALSALPLASAILVLALGHDGKTEFAAAE